MGLQADSICCARTLLPQCLNSVHASTGMGPAVFHIIPCIPWPSETVRQIRGCIRLHPDSPRGSEATSSTTKDFDLGFQHLRVLTAHPLKYPLKFWSSLKADAKAWPNGHPCVLPHPPCKNAPPPPPPPPSPFPKLRVQDGLPTAARPGLAGNMGHFRATYHNLRN